MNPATRSLEALRNSIDGKAMAQAVLVLTPLILATMLSGNVAWLQASLVTISLFVAVERSGLAPLGVVTHALTIAACFLALVASYTYPALFVFLVAALAMGSILITMRDADLRPAGTFTFIPALYLAYEIGERSAPDQLLQQAIGLLPVLALASLPVLVLSAIKHHRSLLAGGTYQHHYARLLQRSGPGQLAPYVEAMIAVTLAVAVSASIVEWQHLPHGQWIIWSAASIVTGDAATARRKFRDRLVGAFVGVPIGVAAGLLLPHDNFVIGFAALVAVLTLVVLRHYPTAFGIRCGCAAVVLITVGQSATAAGERAANVILGGLIGILFVLSVRAIAASREGNEQPTG